MTGAIIQARMGSSRLPGKVLAEIGGKPMLSYVVSRARQARRLDALVVATSRNANDDPIAGWCREAGVSCFRGDEHDVLDRYRSAASAFGFDVIVRLTADCPLLDPAVIDHVIDEFRGGDFDYVSNTIAPSYPDGLDTEVVRRDALERAWREATLPSEREHVTPYIWKRPELFRLENVGREPNLSYLRWTVDEPEDLELVRRVYEHFQFETTFDTAAVLALVEADAALAGLNAGFSRNAGYLASMRADTDAQNKRGAR